MVQAAGDFFREAWGVAGALAPWLFLGLGIAGLLHVLLPADFVRKHLGRPGWGGIVKAAALGVPLPLCSCGVIPAAVGLKKDGASDGAAISFLISTPQTGVDSVMVCAAFLGWPFALFKIVSALVTGVVGGLLVDVTRGPVERRKNGKTEERQAEPKAGPGGCCCCSKTKAAQNTASVTANAAVAAAAVVGVEGRSRRVSGPFAMAREFWHFTAGELFGGIWHWLLVGVLISALISRMFPENSLASAPWAHGGTGMFVMLLIALPMYVCATASVPIAAALIHAGLPAGAALVFLMAGPASNIATIGAVWRTFGRRVTLLYLGVVAGASMGLGYFFNFLMVPVADSAGPAAHAHCAMEAGGGLAIHIWAGVLAVALLAAAVYDFRNFLRAKKRCEGANLPPHAQ